MIPKIVHYIWFGDKPIPNLVEENNKIFGDDWEIKIWTEKDFTFEECQWVKEAKSLNLYMYCSDALRFYIIKNYGGIYLDCDVKIEKLPNSELLELPYAMGIEDWAPYYPNTGIIFGEKNNKVIEDIWNYYCSLSLIQDEEYYIQIYDSDRLNNYNKNKSVYKAKSIQEFKDNYNKFDICYFEAPGFETYKPELDYSFCNHNHTWYWKDVSVGYNGKFYVKPIPKIIHYCWISGEENMPEDIKKCIETWHKYLPDYKFINWNDSNFDWNICEFTKYNREQNNYAFCADYIRFWALYNYGGIYLDTDVIVKKPFNSLLTLQRILTKEILYKKNGFFEAAILGCKKGDNFFKEVLNYYNSLTLCENAKPTIAPIVMGDVAKKFYINFINNVEDELVHSYVLNILDDDKFFNLQSNDCIAQHCFKGSWWNQFDKLNCFDTNNIVIYLCAHKPIENQIPTTPFYKILSQSKEVTAVNDMTYLTDEFSVNHNVCYSEGTAIRFLYNNKDILPEYVGFGHYRRMFVDFIGREQFIPQVVDSKGAIIMEPFDHSLGSRGTNRGGMYQDHPKDDVDTFIQCVYDIVPEYKESFDQLLEDKYQYACNCFIMKREHFLEMCEMCFKVLDEFDRRQHYRNNKDVLKKMQRLSHRYHLPYGIGWQCRLQGFLLEWLTDLYYRHRFGVERCYKSVVGYPHGDSFEISRSVEEGTPVIPKIVHFCWISGDPYPKGVQDCINSWHRYLPDYKFVLWDRKKVESIPNLPSIIKDELKQNHYAFVSDYIRHYAVYMYGGWYFDSDILLLKPISNYIRSFNFVTSLEDTRNYYLANPIKEKNGFKFGVGLEAAMFGAVRGSLISKSVVDYYNSTDYREIIKTLSKGDLYYPLAPQILSKIMEGFGFNYMLSEEGYVLENANAYISADFSLQPSILEKKNRRKLKDFSAIHMCLNSWRK